MSSTARVTNWRPLRSGSMLGFAEVEFPSGLVVGEITVFNAGNRAWANPPARPWVKDGELIRDAGTRKLKWQPTIRFTNREAQASWSRQVIAALREFRPEIFDATTSASTARLALRRREPAATAHIGCGRLSFPTFRKERAHPDGRGG